MRNKIPSTIFIAFAIVAVFVFSLLFLSGQSLADVGLSGFYRSFVAQLLSVTENQPVIIQSSYQFFDNIDSTAVGIQLADKDQAAQAPQVGSAFRLRLVLAVSGFDLQKNSGPFKLQIAETTGTNCRSIPSKFYYDVQADVGDIRFYQDNERAPNRAIIQSNIFDPDINGVVLQTYHSAPGFTNQVAKVPAGELGKWDFALVAAANREANFCFSVVYENGQPLNGYDNFPLITTIFLEDAVGVEPVTIVTSRDVFDELQSKIDDLTPKGDVVNAFNSTTLGPNINIILPAEPETSLGMSGDDDSKKWNAAFKTVSIDQGVIKNLLTINGLLKVGTESVIIGNEHIGFSHPSITGINFGGGANGVFSFLDQIDEDNIEGQTPLLQIIDVGDKGDLHITGKLGVGTADPQAALHVSGKSQFESGVVFKTNVAAGINFEIRGPGTAGNNLSPLPIYIDANSGSLGVGTEHPQQRLSLVGNGRSFTESMTVYSNNIDDAVWRLMNKARGTEDVPQIVQLGDQLGAILFRGHNGNNFQGAAQIGVFVDKTPSSNTMPSRIVFHTAPDEPFTGGGIAGNVKERMRITSDGFVGIGTNNPQYRLHIAGDFNIRGGLFVNGQLVGSADITPPEINILSPADDAVNVAVDTDLIITFNENIKAGAGRFIIYDENDQVFQTTDINSPQVTIANKTVTLQLNNNLASNTGYYVQLVDAGAVKDLSNNNFAGILNATTWNFTTKEIVLDCIPGFTKESSNLSSSGNEGAYKFAVDMDGDGDQDIVAGGNWYENLGDGDFSSQPHSFSGGGETGNVFDVADIDGDGDMDIFSSMDGQGYHTSDPPYYIGDPAKIIWLENFGNGAFYSDEDRHLIYQSSLQEMHEMAPWADAVDMNGDGKMDVISAFDYGPGYGMYQYGIQTMLNDGSGTFTSGGGVINTGAPVLFGTVIDGNIIVATSNRGNISIGGDIVIDRYAPGLLYLTSGDIDGDGGDDLVGGFQGDVIWYANLGGSFSDKKQVASASGPVSRVSVKDIDNDGDQDVVGLVEGSVNTSLVWWENTGDGLFSGEKIIADSIGYAFESTGLVVADIDGDDDLDVLGGYVSDTLDWYEFSCEPDDGDIIAPTLTSTIPTDNAFNIAPNTNLEITFSEPIVKRAGSITIKRASDDQTVQTIDVNNAGVTIAGDKLTIDPVSDLANDTGYYILVAAGAVKDLANNNFAGILNATTWNFNTEEGGTCDVATTMSATLPAPRFKSTAVEATGLNNKIYVFGGRRLNPSDTGDINREILEYDPATDQLVNKGAIIPVIQEESSIVWDNNRKIFHIINHRTEPFAQEVFEYNPANNLITNRGAIRTAPGWYHSAVWNPNNGKVYTFVQDTNPSPDVNQVYEYDPTVGTFTLKITDTSFGYQNSSAVWYAAEDKILVFKRMEVLEYDPIANTTSLRGTFDDFKVSDTEAVWDLVSKKFYVFGTIDFGDQSSSIYEYDPVANAMIELTTLPDVYEQTAMAWSTTQNKAYLFGGYDTTDSNKIFNFIPCGVTDTIPPTLVSTIPIDDAIGVALDSDLEITFNELVKAGTGSIIIKKTAGGNHEVIDINDISRITFEGNKVTINPNVDLDPNVEYYVEIVSNVIKDIAGNDWAGISVVGEWSFTTASATIGGGNIWMTNIYGSITKLDVTNDYTETTHNVGVYPRGIAVDASRNIWVANYRDDTVSMLDATNDYAETTYSVGNGLFGVEGEGEGPWDVAVDANNNIWVTNIYGNTVTKLDATNDYAATTYYVGNGPTSIAVDADNNIWVVTAYDNAVVKLFAGSANQRWVYNGNWRDPLAVAVDANNNIWVVYNAGDVAANNIVIRLSGYGYNYTDTIYNVGDENVPREIAVDANNNIWLANNDPGTNRTVTKLDATNDYAPTTYNISGRPASVAVDANNNIWATNDLGIVVTKLDTANNYAQTTYNASKGSVAIAVDPPVNLWGAGGGFSPTLTTLSPTNNATSVALDSNLKITFNRPIKAGTGSIYIKRVSDDSILETIDINDSSRITFLDNEVGINPTANLESKTEYYIIVGAGVIKGISGNWAGISVVGEWSFETEEISEASNWALENPGAMPAKIVEYFYDSVRGSTAMHLIGSNISAVQIQSTPNDQNSLFPDLAFVQLINSVGTVSGSNYSTYTPLSNMNEACGLTYDTKRKRAIAINCENQGNLYTFNRNDSGSQQFSNRLGGKDYVDIAYLPADDTIYAVPKGLTFDHLDKYNAETLTYVGALALSESIQGVNSYVGVQLKVFNGTDLMYFVNPTYRFNPKTGEVTYIAGCVVPTITNITSNKADGSYATGAVIDIDVTFSEAVTSTDNVTVTLETGDIDRVCTFTVSNATSGTCNYIVQAGDTSADLTTTDISGTIKDTAGNLMIDFIPVINLANNKAIVIDTTPPTLTSTVPADDATLVAITTNLELTFSEPITKGTGPLTIKRSSDNQTTHTIDINNGGITIEGNKLTIDPASDLIADTGYYILVAAGAVKDLANNNFAGISDKTMWSFTTRIADICEVVSGVNIDVFKGSLSANFYNCDTIYDPDRNWRPIFGSEIYYCKNKTGDENVTSPDYMTLKGNYASQLLTTFDCRKTNPASEVKIDTYGEIYNCTRTAGPSCSIEDVNRYDLLGNYTFIVPSTNCPFVHIKTWGAGGGGGGARTISNGAAGGYGGGGGFAESIIAATAGEQLSILVGEGGRGGYSGGYGGGGSGGGASSVKRGSEYLAFAAGGGGGGGGGFQYTGADGGAGGGVVGEVGKSATPRSNGGTGGGGATLFAGGVAGTTNYESRRGTPGISFKGGNSWPNMVGQVNIGGGGLAGFYEASGGGGGGGYYGGGGGGGYDGNNVAAGGGGGGSSIGENILAGSGRSAGGATDQNYGIKFSGQGGDRSKVGNSGQVVISCSPDDSINDNIAPTIITLSPTDNSTDVFTSSALSITFSETIQKGAGSITIKKTADDQTVQTIDINNVGVTVAGNKLTIDPASDLIADTGYYILVAAGAVKDLANNNFAGISDKMVWNWTTVGGGDGRGYNMYRLYVTSKTGNQAGVSPNRAGIHELEFMRNDMWMLGNMTSNTEGNIGGIDAVASASANTTPAWYGFDVGTTGAPKGYDFYVDGTGDVWLRADFAARVNIRGYRFFGGGSNWPTAWEFQGSDDGINWQTLHSASQSTRSQWYEYVWEEDTTPPTLGNFTCPSGKATEELHVAAIYEGSSDHTITAPVSVNISRPGKCVALALSSYESVQWNITASGGTEISKVYILGYKDQKYTGIDPARIEEHSYEGQGDNWGRISYNCDNSNGNLSKIEGLVGLSNTSCQGAYNKNSFIINSGPSASRNPRDFKSQFAWLIQAFALFSFAYRKKRIS